MYSLVGDDKCDSELDCYCEEWSACRKPPVPACPLAARAGHVASILI